MNTEIKLGEEYGEICNRDGCTGELVHHDEGCCTCHINPPCAHCVDDYPYCEECLWNECNDQKEY